MRIGDQRKCRKRNKSRKDSGFRRRAILFAAAQLASFECVIATPFTRHLAHALFRKSTKPEPERT